MHNERRMHENGPEDRREIALPIVSREKGVFPLGVEPIENIPDNIAGGTSLFTDDLSNAEHIRSDIRWMTVPPKR